MIRNRVVLSGRDRGFTIVELLIVIVVIGILAAITIVAFNGVQERARMATALAFEKQIRSKYGADATGIWNFSECSGSTVANTGSASNTDTVTGTATWITDTPSGSGCALRFDGATRIETQASLGATYYVKGVWTRLTNCTGSNLISQAVTGGAVAAFYNPACRPSSGNNGSWGTVGSATAINDGKWHYVAVIWEEGMMTLYVDGKTVSSAASSAALTNPTGKVALAAHAGGNFLNGDLDNPFVAAQ